MTEFLEDLFDISINPSGNNALIDDIELTSDFYSAANKLIRHKYSPDVTKKRNGFIGIVLRSDKVKREDFEPGSFPFVKKNKKRSPPVLVAVKVRIPDLHSMLPVPDIFTEEELKECKNSNDRCPSPIIDLYPTFYSQSGNIRIPKIGSLVVVSYGDMDNFEDPIYFGSLDEAGDMLITDKTRAYIGAGNGGFGGKKTIKASKGKQKAVRIWSHPGWPRLYAEQESRKIVRTLFKEKGLEEMCYCTLNTVDPYKDKGSGAEWEWSGAGTSEDGKRISANSADAWIDAIVQDQRDGVKKVILGFWAFLDRNFMSKAGYMLYSLTKKLKTKGIDVIGWEIDAEGSWNKPFKKMTGKGASVSKEDGLIRTVIDTPWEKGTASVTVNERKMGGQVNFDNGDWNSKLSFIDWVKKARELYPKLELSATVLYFDRNGESRGGYALLRHEEVVEVAVQAYSFWATGSGKKDKNIRGAAMMKRYQPGGMQKLAIDNWSPLKTLQLGKQYIKRFYIGLGFYNQDRYGAPRSAWMSMPEAYRKMSNACLDSDLVDGVSLWAARLWLTKKEDWNYTKEEIDYILSPPDQRKEILVDSQGEPPMKQKELQKILKDSLKGSYPNQNVGNFTIKWDTIEHTPWLYYGGLPSKEYGLPGQAEQKDTINAVLQTKISGGKSIGSIINQVFISNSSIPRGVQVAFRTNRYEFIAVSTYHDTRGSDGAKGEFKDSITVFVKFKDGVVTKVEKDKKKEQEKK